MSPLRIVSLLMLFLGAIEISPKSSARIFLTPRNYPSGESPNAAAVQDFNNDGISDVATANGNNVSVFLNNGNGTFAFANTFSVGEGADELASADLNGDGNADLVVTDDIESAYIVLGNGDGTFAPARKIRLDDGPLGIAIADLNGDSILDLAIAIYGPFNQNQGEAAILIGVGDGTFAAPVFYSLAHDANGLRLVATDLNHDGKLDLAVALLHFPGSKNALAVLLGNGDGTFQPAVLSVPGGALDIAAADFNGDGNIDLALALRFDDTMVLLGNGDGTFQSGTRYSVGGSSETIAIADLNRDRVPDLVVGGDHAATLLGKGDGTFAASVLYGVARFARTGYFNPDRNADVVGGDDSGIVVAFGDANGAFKAPLAYPVEAVDVDGFDLADFDGDGKADLVASGSQLVFFRGLGDGTFAEPIPFDDFTVPWLIAGDFSADGNSDVLLVSGAEVDVILGNGDGTFQPAKFNGAGSGVWPTVGDFNRDGYLDVAGAATGDNELIILLGNGDGTFQPPITYRTDNAPESPIAADFNGDGNPDLAVCNAGSRTVGVYLGSGDGTFAPPLNVTIFGPVFSAAGDLNRDGKVDLVIGAGSTFVFLGNGDGTFQSPLTVLSDYGEMQVADIDRDGRPDIMVAESFSAGLAVIRGGGDGTFRPAIEVPPGSGDPGFFALKDLNGDKTPEAIVNTQNDSLMVLLNISHRR